MLIAEGKAPRIPQDDAAATHAPMLQKDQALIDWTKPAGQLHNLIRGMHPWPVAHTLLEGKPLKVHKAAVAEGSGPAGCVLDEKRMIVACGQGALELVEIQAEGSRRMTAADYLRGHPVKKGVILGS